MIRWLTHAMPLLCTVAVLTPPAFTHAQPAPSPPPDTIDCQLLSRIPNAPMTVETCEKRMAAHLDLMSALETPGGERPGDDRMTCDAIAAEMKTLKVTGVSPTHAAEGEAAAGNAMSILQRAMAEGMGMMATQTARSAAAAAVPGNAPGNAAAMANMAEQKAMQDRLAGQLNPARERLEAANANSMGDLVKAMRANPRFARLVKMGGERNCHG
jgi:hypothetical protein